MWPLEGLCACFFFIFLLFFFLFFLALCVATGRVVCFYPDDRVKVESGLQILAGRPLLFVLEILFN